MVSFRWRRGFAPKVSSMTESETTAFDGVWNLQHGNTVEMIEQLNRAIFAGAVVASSAIGHVRINLHPESQWAFVTLRLRWYARWDWGVLGWWLVTRRMRWLKRAEKNVREILPGGYKLMVYYEPKRREEP